MAKPNLSGRTQVDGETRIIPNQNTEKTRKIVSNFIRDILIGENPDRLTSYFNGNNYIQHNISMADGLDGLGNALSELAKAGIKMIYDKTHYVLACGDYALGISEGSFGGKATTYYDLFRVENDKIAEHWDVMETLADRDTWANNNGKF